jgi:hypothetical protein
MRHINIFLVLLTLSITGCSSNEVLTTNPIIIKSKQLNTLSDDFNTKHPAWSQKSGTWVFEKGVLKQTATSERFPLILFEKEKFSTVDISVDFKPISGRIDASGGIVFRATDKDNYFIVRANALEGNYRLYTFKQGRRSKIASASIDAPEIRKFHTMRVVAKGDHIQAYLNGKLFIDHHDDSFSRGYTGLWTKADSVTEFDNFKVLGL